MNEHKVKNGNGLIDIENKLMIARGEKGKGKAG